MVGVPRPGPIVDVGIVGVDCVFIDVFLSGFDPFDLGRTILASTDREVTGLRTGFKACSGLFFSELVFDTFDVSSFSDLESISLREIFDSGGLDAPS